MYNYTTVKRIEYEQQNPVNEAASTEEGCEIEAARRFLDELLLPALARRSNKNDIDLNELLNAFNEANPDVEKSPCLDDVRDEVAGRIYDQYQPADVSPLILSRAYSMLTDVLNNDDR